MAATTTATGAAEYLGTSLLGEVQEEDLQDLLKQLRHTLHPRPRDILGFEPIDRLLELFCYPSASRTEAEPDSAFDDLHGLHHHHTIPKTRPPIIQLTSPFSTSVLQSSPGKSSILYHLTALCLLPPQYGGRGSAAVWIDTDARFSAQRLSRIMTFIMSSSCSSYSDHDTQEPGSTILRSCLAHLQVIKPATSSALLTSLVQLPSHLKSSSTSRNRALGLVVLDSANAFYFQDRVANDLARLSSPTTSSSTTTTRKPTPPTSESIISALKTVQSTFDCTLAFSTNAMPQISIPNAELTTSLWTSFATLTLYLTRLPTPKFPHSMTLDECLHDRTRRQQAVAKGRVKVYVDIDADPVRREQLRHAGTSFVLRLDCNGVQVEDD